MANYLIRTRINENLLKVENENYEIKTLLNLAVQSSNPKKYDRGSRSKNDVLFDMEMLSSYTKRKDLLRTAILLGTSRNIKAQQNLINIIRTRLGKIKEDDFEYITKLIYLKDQSIVDKVNAFLCKNLIDYELQYNKFYNKYYVI